MNKGFSSKNDEKMKKEHTALLRAQINNSPLSDMEKRVELLKLPVPPPPKLPVPPPPKRGGKRKQRRTHKKRKSKRKSKSKSKKNSSKK
jgi:hypothetical protein